MAASALNLLCKKLIPKNMKKSGLFEKLCENPNAITCIEFGYIHSTDFERRFCSRIQDSWKLYFEFFSIKLFFFLAVGETSTMLSENILR